jgi:hypothetical protein
MAAVPGRGNLVLGKIGALVTVVLPAELAARIQPFLPGAGGTMISEIVGVGDAQA